jgi:hypothetical protein
MVNLLSYVRVILDDFEPLLLSDTVSMHLGVSPDVELVSLLKVHLETSDQCGAAELDSVNLFFVYFVTVIVLAIFNEDDFEALFKLSSNHLFG